MGEERNVQDTQQFQRHQGQPPSVPSPQGTLDQDCELHGLHFQRYKGENEMTRVP